MTIMSLLMPAFSRSPRLPEDFVPSQLNEPATRDRPEGLRPLSKGSPDPSGEWGKAPSPAPSLARRLQRLFTRMLRILPERVVRVFASRYIAGEELEDGVAKARWLHERFGIQSTLDVLGEDVHSRDDVEVYHEEYRKLIQSIAELDFANVSIKLSALGQLLDEEDCLRRVEDIVARAAAVDTFVRIDMEDHSTTSSTLRIYETLRERGHDNVGIVLQSRLFRTAGDVAALARLQPNVRLCIGIYREPPEIALQKKPEMKRHMLELLESMWNNGQHVALATHEEWCIRQALEIADHSSKPPQEIEVQMLLGVPRRSLQKELIARGISVRLYVPYGRHWYAYSMRRLENNPDVLLSILRSLVHSIFPKLFD
jgi:proline dehydrogenase